MKKENFWNQAGTWDDISEQICPNKIQNKLHKDPFAKN